MKNMGILELEKMFAREEAREQGLSEGLMEGLTQGGKNTQINIARNLSNLGFGPELIHKATELPLDEIKTLIPS